MPSKVNSNEPKMWTVIVKMAYSNLYAMFGEKQTNLTLIEKLKNDNNAE